MPDKVKQLINTIYKHPSYCEMTYNRAIPSVVNTLKRIHFEFELLDEFSESFYNNKSGVF